MASPGNWHCASCIGTLSLPIACYWVTASRAHITACDIVISCVNIPACRQVASVCLSTVFPGFPRLLESPEIVTVTVSIIICIGPSGLRLIRRPTGFRAVTSPQCYSSRVQLIMGFFVRPMWTSFCYWIKKWIFCLPDQYLKSFWVAKFYVAVFFNYVLSMAIFWT